MLMQKFHGSKYLAKINLGFFFTDGLTGQMQEKLTSGIVIHNKI